MAAGYRVPKTLCFTAGADVFQHAIANQLLIKSLGSLPASNGKVKMYEIIGSAFHNVRGPVHGSGYIDPDSQFFQVTYTQTNGWTGHRIVSFELDIDFRTNYGELYVRLDLKNGTVETYGPLVITVVDCSSLPIYPPM
jgi:hypothetical protein